MIKKILAAIRRKDEQGVTLVEVLIVMGLLSIFMVVLTDMFSSILDIQSESTATSSVSQDGRYILARLTYDLNRSSSITTPAALGGSGSSLAVVIGGVTYTYAVSGGNLQLTNDLGTNNLNGAETTISSLNVQKVGNVSGKETVKLSVTVTGKTLEDKGAETSTFITTVGRR